MDGNALTKRVLLQGSAKDRMVMAPGEREVDNCDQGLISVETRLSGDGVGWGNL